MKKSFKSVLTFALALVMMVTCMAVTAFASSSDSTTIAGYSASANVPIRAAAQRQLRRSVDHRALMFPRQLLHTTRVVIQTTAVKQVD